MAKAAKYTAQFAVVGTPTQDELLKAVAKRARMDKADAVRFAVDVALGLIKTGPMEGYLRRGDTEEAAIERLLKAMRAAGVAHPEEEEGEAAGIAS